MCYVLGNAAATAKSPKFILSFIPSLLLRGDDMVPAVTTAPLVAARRMSSLRVSVTLRTLQSTRI